MESSLGLLQQASAEPDQNACEGFALYEPGVTVVQRFEGVGVGSANRPGMPSRPSHASPAAAFDVGDLGVKVIGLPPGGSIRMVSFDPGVSGPSSRRMKGFHCGESCVAVRMLRTLSGVASWSMAELRYACEHRCFAG